jgi:leucyl aminopeptidase (aminopeptidase T)
MRAFWSPGVTIELFKETVPIDYRQLRERCARLKAVLDASASVRISNAKGTSVTVGLKGRQARLDNGDFSSPGTGGNLPAGEVFVSPALGTTEGTIVFDGSIANARGDIIIREPIRCRVEGGFVTSIEGGREAELLAATLEDAAARARAMAADGSLPQDKAGDYARNARSIGELGIGLNPMARIVGNMLVDEKAFRTCHFAIGANYDDDAPALIHLDGLVTEPTIVAVSEAGRETVLEEAGVFLL